MEIFSIQYLRAIAAMMVVVVHLYPQLQRMGYQGYWPEWMGAGVDVFFVLSGFLMWITTCEKKVGVMTFYRRRAVRIVPLYWALMSVAVAIMLMAPQLLQTTRFNLFHVIASYLFIMVPNPAGLVEPVLTVGWTLNYEVLYYVVFGLTLALPVAWRFGATALVFGTLAVLGWAGVGGSSLIVKAYTADIMLEFLLGMALGAWFLKVDKSTRTNEGWPALLGWVLVLGGLATLPLMAVMAPGAIRPLAQGIPATAIVGGAILLERCLALPRMKLLHRLGDASYSLYVSHAFVLSAVSQAWRKLHLDTLPGGKAGFCVVAMLCALAGGAIVYEVLEKPLIAFFRKRREQAASTTATRRSAAGL
ncbi:MULTISPECIES: acyltransferase [unclassified Achromobacter]|uniref:acyltransferase family protein n=1 Tax=unclassified Achromobacter TaxID=2626865 RepID=UPI000B51A0BD|nr:MULTISPECIES: acyltransferase [unclassified Achromobacter]OWT74295.1 acyltransferase [Achromobacter sp. HZ34]OWT78762.1 acyltransferase [Achromobacter sp. HZ28]